MFSIAPFFAHTAMRRSLIGALAQDPVVPDPSRRRPATPERAATRDNVRELPARATADHRRAA
jgi:hypothetical protein